MVLPLWPLKKGGVVYKIPCKHRGNGQTVWSQAGRTQKGGRKKLVTGISRDPPADPLPMSITNRP